MTLDRTAFSDRMRLHRTGDTFNSAKCHSDECHSVEYCGACLCVYLSMFTQRERDENTELLTAVKRIL